jgi:hypothetical protein
MWDAWYIIEVRYQYSAGKAARVRFIAYNERTVAQRVFDHLELGFQLGAPIRVKGGKRIRVTGVSLYESFKPQREDAIDAVKSGSEILLQQAHGIEIDLGLG